MDKEQKTTSSWLERVEEIIGVIGGSSVGEVELTEGDTEIIIRRSPNMVLTAVPTPTMNAPVQTKSGGAASAAPKADRGIPIVAPLTGVYYTSASPDAPPFASPGDVVQAGQVVALIEAMKVFNEITSEVTGRVLTIVATNGNVVQKGDVLLRLEAL